MLRHDYARPQGSPLQAEPDLQLRPEPNHRPNEKAQGTKRLPVLFAGRGYSYRKTYYTELNRIEAQRSGFDSGRRRLKAQMKKWQPPKRLPFLSRAERSPTMVGVRRFELRASSLRATLRLAKKRSGLRISSAFSTAAVKAHSLHPPPAAGVRFSQTKLRLVRKRPKAKPSPQRKSTGNQTAPCAFCQIDAIMM